MLIIAGLYLLGAYQVYSGLQVVNEEDGTQFSGMDAMMVGMWPVFTVHAIFQDIKESK